MQATHLAAGAALAATTLVGPSVSGGHPLSSSASAPNTAPLHRHSAIAYGELPTELVVRYTSAARTFGGLSSEILAAIGDIESAHVTIGDATVDPKSDAVRPPAVGPPRRADPFNFLIITTTTWAARRRTTLFDDQPDIDSNRDRSPPNTQQQHRRIQKRSGHRPIQPLRRVQRSRAR